MHNRYFVFDALASTKTDAQMCIRDRLKYTGRAPVVHLKDFVMQGREKPQHLYELIGIETDGQTASDEAFGFRPVGSGVQDFPSILAASQKAGAEWVIVEQDRPAPGARCV